MSTILVGVYNSDRSDDAIALARDLARAARCRIVLAAAVPYPAIALVGNTAATLAEESIERETESALASRAATLEGDGIAVDCVTEGYVSAPHLLQSLADRTLADLIVVGSTRAGRMGCPVIVTPRGVDRPLERLFPATVKAAPAP